MMRPSVITPSMSKIKRLIRLALSRISRLIIKLCISSPGLSLGYLIIQVLGLSYKSGLEQVLNINKAYRPSSIVDNGYLINLLRAKYVECLGRQPIFFYYCWIFGHHVLNLSHDE